MPTMIADCNNFYASCERVFDASLRGRPVVVLSNNDGCVIARSQEAKDVGVEMGAPAFKCEELFRQHNVAVRSANFPLYGDMSARVMKILEEYADAGALEKYSIDEAFLEFPATRRWTADATLLAREAVARIKKWTGLPVSIGIATTKTLAKLANMYAKRSPDARGVFCFEAHSEPDWLLAQIPVVKIWGIGWRRSRLLHEYRIETAYDLKRAHPQSVRRLLSVAGLRTQMELNGKPCLELEEVPPHHTVLSSRSFGKSVYGLSELQEAVASFTSLAAEKMRKHGRAAGVVQVFVRIRETRRSQDAVAESLEPPEPAAADTRPGGGWYAAGRGGGGDSATVTLPVATAFTPTLAAAAHHAVERIYRPGTAYIKAGILLADLCPADTIQLNLFGGGRGGSSPDSPDQRELMHTIDRLNRKYGNRTVFLLGTGIEKGEQRTRNWQGRRQFSSPRYTTCLSELFTVGEAPDGKQGVKELKTTYNA